MTHLKSCDMWNIRTINYVNRILETDEGFRFDILYVDNLIITNNVIYKTADECVDALCVYLKKLCSHPVSEPFEVKL